MMPLQIAGTEWIWVILVLAVLLFGSKKLPELARSVGKAIGEFQKGRQEIEREIREATTAVDITKPLPPQPATILTPQVVPPPPPKSAPQPAHEQALEELSDRERLERTARDLGIDPTDKSDEELRREIHKTLME